MADPSTTQVFLPAREAVRHLVEAGVVRGLDDATLDKLRDECWDDDEEQMEDAGLLGILTSYYETIEKGARDGFYWRDDQFWQQTDDVIAELAPLLGPTPLFKQIEIGEKLVTTPKKEVVRVLAVERDDGQTLEIDARSLDDVVAAFNQELKARGQARRLVPLDTSGEWRMYVAMDLEQARKLAREGALPVDDMEGLVD